MLHRARELFAPRRCSHCIRSIPMLDVVMLGLGLGFFILTLGYAYACERL
jgi:hypothetical protein